MSTTRIRINILIDLCCLKLNQWHRVQTSECNRRLFSPTGNTLCVKCAGGRTWCSKYAASVAVFHLHIKAMLHDRNVTTCSLWIVLTVTCFIYIINYMDFVLGSWQSKVHLMSSPTYTWQAADHSPAWA